MPLIGKIRLFLPVIFLISLLIIPASISARRHRHFRGHERHFSRQNLEEIPEEKLAEKPKHQQRRAPRIICVHGSPVGGRCICEQGWAGINCQSEMHCATFERTPNGSCTQCQPNFGGDRCELPECQNGGQPMQNEQRCECPKPYSGNFCEELLTKNVYYFYNSKVATVGPLGLLAVIPMIGVYVLCERFARKRQVRRIEKTWNEQQMDGQGHVNPQHIELLLKEKA